MATCWWRRTFWLLGFACLWLNVWDDPPLHTGAYLQDVTETTAVVGMVTAEPTEATVTVRDGAGKIVKVLQQGGRRRHSLRIEGMQPASEYRYEVRIDGIDVDAGSIRTADPSDQAAVRFVFLGDSGGQPWWVWLQRTSILHWPARWGWFAARDTVTRIGAAVAAFRPDFVLHLGDVVYPRGLNAHYQAGFFQPFAEALRHAPFYVALGNHDVMDAGGQQALANLGWAQGDLTGDARCFSFVRGPVRVVVLDFNSFGLGDPHLVQSPVFTFLQRTLAACEEPWIVVASHFPMRSASRAGNRGDLLKFVLPELEAAGVSLYLSGHDHCYQRFGDPEAGQMPLVVSGGGGKDLYAVHPDRRAAVLASAFHWCTAEVEAGVMQVRSHGLEGVEIDSFQLRLPRGEALERLRRSNPRRAARIEVLRRG